MKTHFFQKCSIVFGILLLVSSMSLYAQKPTAYVNPFIGTSNGGGTHPGATAPRGMVSVSPFNVIGSQNKLEKDSHLITSPYVHDNSFLTGFSHVNLSGVDCPDLGVILAMPTTGPLETDPMKYGSTYTEEDAKAGYYTTTLSKSNIKVEATASTRVGLSKYTFPAGQANILINLGLGLTPEQGATVKVVSPYEIEGMRFVGNFCDEDAGAGYAVYFVARVNVDGAETGMWKTPSNVSGAKIYGERNQGKPRIYKDYYKEVVGNNIGGFFTFNFDEETDVELKVGVSYVSIENARENLDREAKNHSFLQLFYETELAWNKLLSRVMVSGGTEDDKTMFYTALYHTLLHPSILNDINGEFPMMRTRKTSKTEGTRHTFFSLSHTYQNLHPLMSLIYPEQQVELVWDMLDIYDETGWLPKSALNATESFSSVGDPATIVIADTYLRGIKNFDINKAYEAMKKCATQLEHNPVRPGIRNYLSKGYLTTSDEVPIAATGAYNCADFALSKLATALWKKADQYKFAQQAISYRNLFDDETKFLRPKLEDGRWVASFDPSSTDNFVNRSGYSMGNSWQHTFAMSHDIVGLTKLMGGRKRYVDQLQRVFDENHFDMSNLANISYPYLFTKIRGEAWRTEIIVNQLRAKHFKNAPWGLPGNDQAGSLSAWLVYSMMGIYPLTPADPTYVLTAPVFDKIVIVLDTDYYEGRLLVIEKEGVGTINKIVYNDNSYREFSIDHKKLVNGGRLKFILKE
ncbi:GH92 family glycosyl hydrolase [Flavobacteriaceae bacterium F08102]|nr:GH92 family glycosyl hydrolase [Flavobacteriaceae bacterium F08102]